MLTAAAISGGLIGMRSASVAIALLFTTVAGVRAADDPYSPYTADPLPQRVFWGDTHLHTTNSPDAYLFGVRLSPDDAFDFAKGKLVTATHGLPVRLERPLDFLVVSDHAEYLGLVPRMFAGDPKVTETEYGAALFATVQRDGPRQAAMELIADLANNREKMQVPGLAVSIWEEVAATADRHDDPGVFTAFIGYEWTSMIRGNNLHRIVLYRDGADRAARLVPGRGASVFRWPDDRGNGTGA
jgi:hypothetical protein